MTFSDKALTAWSNLGRRKVRTALTSTGVVVGIMTMVTMVSLVNGVHEQVVRQFQKIGLDRVTVKPPGGADFMSPGGPAIDFFGLGGRTKIISAADVKRWASWPEVKEAAPEVELPYGVVAVLQFRGQSRPVRLVGAARRGPFMPAPTALAGSIEVPARGGVVLNRGIFKPWHLAPAEIAKLVGQQVSIVLRLPRGPSKSFALKVTGITTEGFPLARLGVGDRLAMKSWWTGDSDTLAHDGYDTVVLRCPDVSQAKLVVDKLRKEKFDVQSVDAILDVANRIFSVVTAMLALVSSVALFVACIGIVNTMVMSIYERTREIGTLKAMGASASDIRTMFMIEAGLIGLMGGAAGLVGSWLLGRGLNRVAHVVARHKALPLPDELFIITPALVLQALLLALIIGVLAGLYPANRAARLDPLLALRHE